MEKISVVIITKNESQNIARCIKSALWANEIVLLDTGSSDNTIDIAQNLGAKVHTIDKWEGFGMAKQKVVSLATYDWVVSVDADEEFTTELKQAIQNILEKPKYMIYRIKRKSFYLGKLIEYSGWNNDYPIRLFNRNYAGFNNKKVHESIDGNHQIGKIESYLLHYTYNDINSHLRKMILYSDLALEENPNKKISKFGILFRGIFQFIQMYILNRGFLDGNHGFVLAIMSSISVMTKYIKYYEKNIK